MRKTFYLSGVALALALAAACATAQNDDSPFQPGVDGSTPQSDGGGPVGPLSGDDGSSVMFGGDGGAISNYDAGGASLVDGQVVGTCVVGRSCDPTCDQLQEGGQHEYVELAPDDGSKLPPMNVATMFSGTPSTSGGPCITEPPDGALYPNNWLRPRIAFTPATGQTIFQIRIHADRQMQDMIVYTRSKTWKMPADVWAALASSTWSEDITVTVSSISETGGTPASSSVKFQIAPANANGSMIYWAAVGDKNGLSWLEGFRVGDDNVSRSCSRSRCSRASRGIRAGTSTRTIRTTT